MKNSFLFALLFSVMVFASCSSHKEVKEDQVPGAVVSAVKAKYPTAVISKWITEEKEGKTIYEAVLKDNGEEIEAEFNADGSFIKEH